MDNRIESVRNALLQVISAATNSGNLIVKTWAEETRGLLDRMFTGISAEQVKFWQHEGDERERILGSVERTVASLQQSYDMSIAQLDLSEQSLSDAAIRVFRASKEPLVLTHWPTYIVPEAAGDAITLIVRGRYLDTDFDKRPPELLVNGAAGAKVIGHQEGQLQFSIPRSMLPANSNSPAQVTFDLKVASPPGWFTSESKPYGFVSYVLPSTVGNVKVIGVERSQMPRSSTFDYPQPPQEFSDKAPEGGSSGPTPHCVPAHDGYQFDLRLSKPATDGSAYGYVGSAYLNGKGDLCANSGTSAPPGKSNGIGWHMSVTEYRLEDVNLTEEVPGTGPLSWKRGISVVLPKPYDAVLVQVDYPDGTTMVFDGIGPFKYLRVDRTNFAITINPALVRSNLETPVGR